MLEIKNFPPAEVTPMSKIQCIAMWDDDNTVGMC